MKKFATFLMTLALALVGTSSAFAQKPEPVFSELADDGNTVQYLYNVGSGAFLLGANDWNTRASVSATKGYQFKVANNGDGTWTLNDYVETQSAWKAVFADNASSIWVDNLSGANVKKWVITSLGDNKYEITNPSAAGGKLGTPYHTDTRVYLNDNLLYTTWAFVSEEAYNTYLREYASWLEAGEYTIGDDVSLLLNTADWTCPQGNGPGWYWAAGDGYRETYNGDNYVPGKIMYQKHEGLLEGAYEVQFYAVSNSCWLGNRIFGTDIAQIYANTETYDIEVFDQGSCNPSTYLRSFTAIVGSDGVLEYGIQNVGTGGNWCVARLGSIKYVADASLAPYLGEVTITPTDGSSLLPEEVSTVDIEVPFEKIFKDASVYTVTVKGVLSVNGEEEEFEVSGAYGETLSFDISEYSNAGTSIDVVITSVEVTDNELEEVVVTSEDTVESSFRIATLTEIAKKNYEEALAEAYAHLEEAQTHKGVGLQLYLPAQIARYEEALEAVAELGEDYAIYNDYVEGTDLLKALIRELQPQRPKLNQRYILTQKSSGLKLNADNGVALAGVGTPVQFHHADGDVYYVYSTPDREYIGYTNANKWTLTNDASKYDKELGKFALKHNHETQAYNLVGINGAIGSDATDAGSALYGNKAETAANSQWLIEEYIEPVVADDELAPGEYYIRNAATGKFLGGANSWGTQASIIEHGIDIKVAIADGLYTLDTKISNGGDSHFLGNGGYVDAAAYGFNIVKVSKYYWEIEDPATGKVYSANGDDTTVNLGEENGNYSYWEFLTKAELLEELADGYTNDATFLIQDPNFGRNDQRQSAWTMSSDCTNQNLSGGNNENNCAESWHSTFTLSQEVEVPNGNYVLKCQGFYRIDDNNTDEHAILYANDEQVTLMNIVEGATAESIYTTTAWDTDTKLAEGYVPNCMIGSSMRFSMGMYAGNEVPVTVTNGKLTIGIKCTQTHDWVIWDNFELFAVSDTEMAILKARSEAAAEEATAINSVSETIAPAAIYSVNGAQLNSLQKGINIVKMSDGSFKKILVK